MERPSRPSRGRKRSKFAPHAYVKRGGAPAAAGACASARTADPGRSPSPRRPISSGQPTRSAPGWRARRRRGTSGTCARPTNWPSGLPGGGKTAIIELDGGWAEFDMRAFFAGNNLPYPNIVDVPVTGYPGAGNNPNQHIGDPQDPDIEVAMDIQVAAAAYSLATGKAAEIKVYWSGRGATGGIADAVRQATADGCDVCSISWGADEARWQLWSTSDRHYLLGDGGRGGGRRGAPGVIVFAASGDDDSERRRRRCSERRCAVVMPERCRLRRTPRRQEARKSFPELQRPGGPMGTGPAAASRDISRGPLGRPPRLRMP